MSLAKKDQLCTSAPGTSKTARPKHGMGRIEGVWELSAAKDAMRQVVKSKDIEFIVDISWIYL